MKYTQKTSKGFSLIELIIVVTVIAILAGIAFPAYLEQMQRARRSDAQTALLNLATLMEHYYTENNSYSGATPTGVGGSNSSPEGFYTISISSLTATSYTLSAAPTAGGPQVGDACGTFTLTNTNIRSTAACW